MKILWYIPRLNIGGAESLTVSILNYMSQSMDMILVTDKINSSQINQINHRIKVIDLKDSSGIFYFFKIINLRKIIFSNMDYFFISNLTHANLNSYIALLFSKKKTICIEHNTLSKYLSHNFNFKKLLMKVLCKFIYKRIHRIITVSNYVKEDLEKSFKCKNCWTIHNGIDITSIKKKANLFKPRIMKPYIIFVGRLEKQKNLIKLIEIYKQLVSAGLKQNLMIIGDGSEILRIKSKVEKFKLKSKVKFLGYQENPYPYIKNADLSIMTSNFEGFGIFLIESLALGVKIFTYDKKIISEIIDDDYYINLFTANDSESSNIEKIEFLLKSNLKKNNLKKLAMPYDTTIVSKKYVRAICH